MVGAAINLQYIYCEGPINLDEIETLINIIRCDWKSRNILGLKQDFPRKKG